MSYVHRIINAIAILVLASAFSYFLIVVMPEELGSDYKLVEKQHEWDVSARVEREKKILECISASFDSYRSRWDDNCPLYGKPQKTPPCNLPGWLASELKDGLDAAKKDCYKLYP